MKKKISFLASMVLLATATGAFAQAWPARPGTPAAIVDSVAADVKEAVSIPEVRDNKCRRSNGEFR